MVDPDKKFMEEQLRKIQAGITDLRGSMVELRNEMRDLKEAQISTREEIQALRRDVLRQERGFAALQLDMDQVKTRLDPHHDAE
jgi:predicted  nucleic acid-binding Zn-ribbon protein